MKCIVTMQIGKGKGTSRDIWPICTDTIQRYADKIGVEFFILKREDPFYYNTSFYMQKFQIMKFTKIYDQVLALDSDIFITPDAPNIFEVYPEIDTFYGMDEGYTAREGLVQPYIEKYEIEWVKSEYYGTYVHYNGGVYIYGDGCDLSYNIREFLPIKGYEENFINYIIQKNKVKNVNIDRKWNKICSDRYLDRRDCYFIHHAGPGFVKKDCVISDIWNEKLKIVKDDYEYFYGKR